MKEIKYILLQKKNKTMRIETAKLDESKDTYTFITSLVGEQGELSSLCGMPRNIMLVYDDHYGWDKTSEDFINDMNEVASHIAGKNIYGDCIICRIRDIADDDVESPYEICSLNDEDIEMLYKYANY